MPFDYSLTQLLLVLFGLSALFALIIGIRMPKSFTDDEKVRAALKKKLYAMEKKAESGEDQVT
jgi:ABC-type long-subunit fatty acid transport system fused permease/ATPase subunit